MKRITERDNILGVAEQWDAQYSINIKGLTTHATEEQLAISKRLRAMNLQKVKASTVDKVIDKLGAALRKLRWQQEQSIEQERQDCRQRQ